MTEATNQEQEEKKSLVIYHLTFENCHLETTDFMSVELQFQPTSDPHDLRRAARAKLLRAGV